MKKNTPKSSLENFSENKLPDVNLHSIQGGEDKEPVPTPTCPACRSGFPAPTCPACRSGLSGTIYDHVDDFIIEL